MVQRLSSFIQQVEKVERKETGQFEMVQEKKKTKRKTHIFLSERQKILKEHFNQHNKFAQGAKKERLFVKMKTSTEIAALQRKSDHQHKDMNHTA